MGRLSRVLNILTDIPALIIAIWRRSLNCKAKFEAVFALFILLATVTSPCAISY